MPSHATPGCLDFNSSAFDVDDGLEEEARGESPTEVGDDELGEDRDVGQVEVEGERDNGEEDGTG